MSTALIDQDCLTNKKDFYFDLDIMKLASYYRAKKEITKLLLIPSEYTQYTRTYFIKNRFNYKMFGQLFRDPRIIYRGYAFAAEGYDPLPEDIEKANPDATIYDTYLHFNDKRSGHSIDYMSTLNEICHARLSTNGTTCNIPISSILYKDSDGLCIHDFNILALTGWKEVLDECKDKRLRTRFPAMTSNIEDVVYLLTNYKIFNENHLVLTGLLSAEQRAEIIALGKIYKDRIRLSFFEGVDINDKQGFYEALIYAMNTILEMKYHHLRVHAYIDPHDITEKTIMCNNIAYWSNNNHGDVSLYYYIHYIRKSCIKQIDTLAEHNEVFNYLYNVIPSKWTYTI